MFSELTCYFYIVWFYCVSQLDWSNPFYTAGKQNVILGRPCLVTTVRPSNELVAE